MLVERQVDKTKIGYTKEILDGTIAKEKTRDDE